MRNACVVLAATLLVGGAQAQGLPDPVGPSDLITSEGLRSTVFGIEPERMAELPEKVPTREYNLRIKGGMAVPDLFWFNRHLRVWFSAQPQPAPLVIAVAGTGGDGNTGKLRILRRALYDAGYHVLTLPSPSFPGFATAASSTGVAGDLRQDARDLLRVARQALAELPRDVRISAIHVVGYSLGASHAAMMKVLDEGPDELGLQRVVLLNPPVDLFASVARFDRMFADHIGESQAEIERFYQRLFADLAQLYRQADVLAMDEAFLLGAASRLLRTDEEFSAAIALSFRLSLINMFFSGDYYAGTGVVVDPADPPQPGDSLDREFVLLRTKPFSAYVRQVFAPFYLAREPGLDLEGLIARNSLVSIADRLHDDEAIFVQHNADDLIIDSRELAWLRETLTGRIAVYPGGGHLGNLGERQQIADLLAMLAGSWQGEGAR